MKVISIKQKGYRMMKCINFNHKKQGKTKRPFSIAPLDFGWWFCLKTGEWIKGYDKEFKRGRKSNYYAMKYDGFNDIYSLKAAKRKISNWNVPRGTKFRVEMPFVNYDFVITKP